ncbi:MAG: RHS repeat-associated core domain-containing protein [Terrisporobacter sp.]
MITTIILSFERCISIAYTYDRNGNGERVEKSENCQSTKYYYQNDSVLYTTGSADKSTELEEPDKTEIMTGVTSLNLMGTSENVIVTVRDISSSEGEKYYFYNKDMRESTTNVVGVEGKSEVAYEYTDFGETEIKGDENFFNEICYTGGIYDKKTGLYYLNARYYNPEDGRFLTEDTYRGENSYPSGLHLYTYTCYFITSIQNAIYKSKKYDTIR